MMRYKNTASRFASMAEYFAYVDKLTLDIDAVSYEDNRVVLTFEEA